MAVNQVSTKKPTNYSINQQTKQQNQPTNQPANQPTNQLSGSGVYLSLVLRQTIKLLIFGLIMLQNIYTHK